MAEETAPAIDLVISDMVMPEMGGRTLAEQLEQRLPNVPILLMSGYTRDALTGSLDLGPRVAFIEIGAGTLARRLSQRAQATGTSRA